MRAVPASVSSIVARHGRGLPRATVSSNVYTDGVSARITRRRFAASVSFAAAWLVTDRARTIASLVGAEDPESSVGDLDAFVRARMEAAHVPGLSLAIIRDGKLLRAAG